MQTEEQRREREFRALLDQGRRLFEERSYDQARLVLSRAAQLRPDDPSCRRLLAQAQRALGGDTSLRLLERSREEHRFKRVSLALQLELSLFEAQKALDAGQHGRALEHARRVVAGASYAAVTPQVARLCSRAEEIIAAAREAEQEGFARQRKNDLAAARKDAARDQASTLRTLRDRGWRYVEAGKHDKASKAAEEMLRIKPGDRQALVLREAAGRGRGGGEDIESLRAERKEAQDAILYEEIEKAMTVPEDITAKVVLPGERAPSRAVGLLDRSMEPWERRIREKLRERISVELKGATVSDACRYLSDLTDCTILVDPAVGRSSKRFSLPKMTLSFEHVMRWLCRFSGVTFTLRDHAILVTRRGGLLDQPTTRDYDVAGMLMPVRSVKHTVDAAVQAERADWRRVLADSRTVEEKDDPTSRGAIGNAWVRFIRSTVAPGTWSEPGEAGVLQEQRQYTIQYRNGRIVVVHTPEVQKQIEQLLNDFRRARNLQVHIFARFIEMRIDYLENFDIDWGLDLTREIPHGIDYLEYDNGNIVSQTGIYGATNAPELFTSPPGLLQGTRYSVASVINEDQVGVQNSLLPSGGLSFSWGHLSDRECNLFVNAVLKRRKGTLLIAPRLTCFNTQRANFQAVTNYNYVRSISSDNEPEIGNVPDGIIFDVQPFVSADRRYITLVLQPQLRTLLNKSGFRNPDDPTEGAAFEFITPLPGFFGPQRRVVLPVVRLQSVATTVTVPDGGTLLIGGLARAMEERGYSSVPFITGIPLLKYLFRETTDAEARTSLIILVTATIVPDIFEE